MGQDKARLPWGRRTLLDHMTARLQPLATYVEIVGRTALPDRVKGRGPVEGIRTALAATTTEQNLIVAVDLPILEPAFLDYLMGRLDETEELLVACEIGDRVPLCLGMRRALLPLVEEYLESGGRSVQGLVSRIGRETITEQDLARLGMPAGMFRNLNTREEYEEVRRECFR
jgi:molybdopterin-guanine dinucleotide biosynthesis protein A